MLSILSKTRPRLETLVLETVSRPGRQDRDHHPGKLEYVVNHIEI